MKFTETIPQIGCVEWIGLRTSRGGSIAIVDWAQIDEQGLVGDFFTGPRKAPRAVTLIQAEHLPVVASIMGVSEIGPELLRRNIVVSKINLKSLKNKQFRIGSAILQGTGNCAPCGLMERQLGPGGYHAMRGHGGITACVIQPGSLKLGDPVKLNPE